jgi:hypothetical protein
MGESLSKGEIMRSQLGVSVLSLSLLVYTPQALAQADDAVTSEQEA